MTWFTKTRRAQNDQDYEAWQEGGVCPTLNAFDNHTETRATVVIEDPTVRRLTPLECERLQGFPDGWAEGQSDSQRYKQMGNAVAVPVVEWVIQGIVELER
jgi:site-specific DNA-cytosine methylase